MNHRLLIYFFQHQNTTFILFISRFLVYCLILSRLLPVHSPRAGFLIYHFLLLSVGGSSVDLALGGALSSSDRTFLYRFFKQPLRFFVLIYRFFCSPVKHHPSLVHPYTAGTYFFNE